MAKIIRTDLVAGQQGDVLTVKNTSTDAIENGDFFNLGALIDGDLGRSTRKIEKLAEGKVLAYLDDPAVMYDETKDERDYQLLKDKVGRARRAKVGEQITIAKTVVDGDVAVGDELMVKPASYQLTKKTTGNKSVAVILEDTIFEGQASWFIEFL